MPTSDQKYRGVMGELHPTDELMRLETVIRDSCGNVRVRVFAPVEGAALDLTSAPTIPVRLDLADHLIDALLAVGDHAGAQEIREAIEKEKTRR